MAQLSSLAGRLKRLWAIGDTLWGFGTERNIQKLLRYERQLEELFRRQPLLCGICQYHGDLLPDEILRQGLLTHRAVFINETLSRIHIHYAESYAIVCYRVAPLVVLLFLLLVAFFGPIESRFDQQNDTHECYCN